MTNLSFRKMHGLGNDFVIIDIRDGIQLPPKDVIGALTHRKTGIGCDQFIPFGPPKNPEADAFMRILNAPDASEVEACGNATRCVASILMKEQDKDEIVIETVAGLLKCRAVNGDREMIEVDMGIPKLDWQDIPLSEERDTLHLGIGEGDVQDPVGVNIGNPHAVFFVEDAEALNIEALGPGFETDPLFPAKANIEFAHIIDRQTIRMRVWERDTGVTAACGSAACATMVAAVRRDLVDRKADVVLDGGALSFHWREDDNHILMTGPVSGVFEGKVNIFN